MRHPGAAIALIVLGVTHSLARAEAVAIYTTATLPPVDLDGAAATIIRLDGPQRMVRGLSRHTADNAITSPQHIAQRILGLEGEGFFSELQAQVNGLVFAWRHGIDALPAIVIDDRYVFYGVYSVAEAKTRLQSYRTGAGP